MFVKRIKNKNGKTYVQVVDKSSGKYKVLTSVGNSSDKEQIKQIGQGKLSKSNINNKGYNKYLKLDGEINVSIDYDKYKADACWDGLKGYIANSSLSKDEIIENYNQLWQIENAFRVSKTDLKIRPIQHRLPKRIEAHICLTFVAYKVYKELERQLKEKKANISVQKAIEIIQSVYEIEATTTKSKEKVKHLLLLTD